MLLAVLAGEVVTPDGMASLWSVQQGTERAGLTKMGFTLAVRRLKVKAIVQQAMDSDQNGNLYAALSVTETGWDWIEANENRFVLRRPTRIADPDLGITEDDIPF
jgi:hypothetical protein